MGEILAKIGFDWHIALSHTVNFGLIFFLLVKFALPNIKKVINERTAKIKDGLKKADDAKFIFDKAKQDRDALLHDAEIEKKSIIATGEKVAESLENSGSIKAKSIIDEANALKAIGEKSGFDNAIKSAGESLPNLIKLLSQKAFDGRVDADINSDFVGKIFKENFIK
jgi:F-type H+-transporting ATPase subunit b